MRMAQSLLICAHFYLLDLDHEYSAIMKMYQEEKVTAPIRAFFGEYLKRPIRRKQYPLALLNHRVNLDQLLAINNAMRYPLAYIQGPPGTGKTNTIMNTIMDVFRLIESLISDIQHLESEVVRTRYELSKYLPEKERNLLRSDILANLGSRYAGDPAYDAFVQEWCGGSDPMDADEWVEHIWKLAHDEVSERW